MSYTLTIGNAVLRAEWPGEYEPVAAWEVERVEHEAAPAFPGDDMTGRSNARHPAYATWGEFCRLAGLNDVFFAPGGLLRPHPGIKPLGPEQLSAFEEARAAWISAHPGTRGGFCGCGSCNPWERIPSFLGHDATLDGMLARLEWLCYWTRWAVESCDRPAFENS